MAQNGRGLSSYVQRVVLPSRSWAPCDQPGIGAGRVQAGSSGVSACGRRPVNIHGSEAPGSGTAAEGSTRSSDRAPRLTSGVLDSKPTLPTIGHGPA
jgi:hypothetical protein